jgi:hypothetical protein
VCGGAKSLTACVIRLLTSSRAVARPAAQALTNAAFWIRVSTVSASNTPESILPQPLLLCGGRDAGGGGAVGVANGTCCTKLTRARASLMQASMTFAASAQALSMDASTTNSDSLQCKRRCHQERRAVNTHSPMRKASTREEHVGKRACQQSPLEFRMFGKEFFLHVSLQ